MVREQTTSTSDVKGHFVLERLGSGVEVDHVYRPLGILAVLLDDLAVCRLARTRRPHHHLGESSRRSHDDRAVTSMLLRVRAVETAVVSTCTTVILLDGPSHYLAAAVQVVGDTRRSRYSPSYLSHFNIWAADNPRERRGERER